MVTVIYGGSGSGKSAYAEEKALSYGEPLYYLATMRICDEEGRKKVERHKQLRAGKGFHTIEKPVKVEEAAEWIEENATILLECMSNLAANEMFEEGKQRNSKEVAEEILYGIKKLSQKAGHLLIVTNNVFEEGTAYQASTLAYMEALGLINQYAAELAGEVIEVAAGIPVTIKKECRQGR